MLRRLAVTFSLGCSLIWRPSVVMTNRAAHSDDVDQSFRFDADQIGAKRRKALSV